MASPGTRDQRQIEQWLSRQRRRRPWLGRRVARSSLVVLHHRILLFISPFVPSLNIPTLLYSFEGRFLLDIRWPVNMFFFTTLPILFFVQLTPVFVFCCLCLSTLRGSQAKFLLWYPASLSSRAMENGDDVSYVYYDITFDWHGAEGKGQKKIVSRGIGAVEVSVFHTGVHHHLITTIIVRMLCFIFMFCLAHFDFMGHRALQPEAPLWIEFESPYTTVTRKRRMCLNISTWTSATTPFYFVSLENGEVEGENFGSTEQILFPHLSCFAAVCRFRSTCTSTHLVWPGVFEWTWLGNGPVL